MLRRDPEKNLKSHQLTELRQLSLLLYLCQELLRVPDKLFLHQGEVPEGTDIQLEELDKGLQHLLSLRVPLQQSFSASLSLFTTLCKTNKR